MSNIKNSQRFAELEYGLQKYFDSKVASVMTAVQNDLSKKQVDEIKSYRNSFAGMMSMANYDKGGDTTMTTLKHIGKWNSKTVEDYVAMCQQKLQNDKGFQKDLLTLATEWRNTVVRQIGREKYDQLSAQLGADLAYAYVGTRMDDLMMQKLVKDNMPKSTADYIIRKAAQGSIWGLEQEMFKSPMAREIEAKGEKAFNPSKGAKVAGKVTSSVMDAATLGVGSWTSFATYVGGDMLVNAMFSSKPTGQQKEQVMETAISKGVFGSNSNVFKDFRKQSTTLQGKDNQYLSTLNSKLNNKIVVPFKPLMDFNIFEQSKTTWQPKAMPGMQAKVDRTSGKYKDVPLIVAPGQEDAYLEAKAKAEAAEKAQTEKKKAEDTQKAEAKTKATTEKPSNEVQSANASQTVSNTQESTSGTQQQISTFQENLQRTASNGWDQLMQASGLKGIGSTFGNLGYVVSMLPDVLVGMFTGNTKSLNMKNTMMPIASILLGLFVRNPLLKMMLIGFGGANLINKAGKESLSWQQQDNGQQQSQAFRQPQYRQYADEPLNPRITNPVLQGSTLIASIDRVPCNIQLTQNVVAAYQAGALPLNTLANAILAKHDASQVAASRQYGQVAQQTIEQNQTETIHRTR